MAKDDLTTICGCLDDVALFFQCDFFLLFFQEPVPALRSTIKYTVLALYDSMESVTCFV